MNFVKVIYHMKKNRTKKTLLVFAMLLGAFLILGQTSFSRKTPEPGTKLSFPVNLYLPFVNSFIETAIDSTKDQKFGFMVNLSQPKLRNVIDTFVANDNFQVPIRIYFPNKKIDKSQDLNVIVFYHGGGFILGSIDSYNQLAHKLCQETNTILVSVGYRLADEAPFPAAIEDAYAALLWVKQNIKDFGGNPNHISVVGDSAGGNIASAMCLKDSKLKNINIKSQVLIYPSCDMRDTLYPSREYFAKNDSRHFVFSRNQLEIVKQKYLRGKNDENPLASTIKGKIDKSFPPCLIITAQCDPLRDEGKAFFNKLKQENVVVEYSEYKGMIHGFLSMYSILPKGKKGIKEVAVFLEKY